MLVFRAIAHFISLLSDAAPHFPCKWYPLFSLSISYLNVKRILSLDRDLSEQGGFSYESVYNGPISLPYDTLITLVSCRILSLFRQHYDPSVVFLSIRDLTQQEGWKKTQGGRMTKIYCACPGLHSLAPHFFVFCCPEFSSRPVAQGSYWQSGSQACKRHSNCWENWVTNWHVISSLSILNEKSLHFR